MSDRITKTQKWSSDAWFMDLKANSKLLFLYLTENCDEAGFYEVSMKRVKEDLHPLSTEEIKQSFNEIAKSYILSTDKKILLLRNFVRHQNKTPLSRQKVDHRDVFKAIEAYMSKFEVNVLKIINQNKKPIPQKADDTLQLLFQGNSIDDYLTEFNLITGRDFKKTSKLITQFTERVKDKYKVQDFIKALKNAMSDDYHKDNNFNYLTPIFFTNTDKLEKYLNYQYKAKPKQGLQQGATINF